MGLNGCKEFMGRGCYSEGKVSSGTTPRSADLSPMVFRAGSYPSVQPAPPTSSLSFLLLGVHFNSFSLPGGNGIQGGVYKHLHQFVF